jgi:hypothetical protein
MRFATLVSLTAVLLACNATPAPDRVSTGSSNATVSGVTATRVTGGIQIVNGATASIAYVVVNPNWLGLLADCSDPAASCPVLGTGQTATVVDAAIHGFDAGTRSVDVQFWTLDGLKKPPQRVTISF